MEKVIYSLEFHEKLEELVEILYKKEYFGFLDSSVLYVLKIYDFVDENINKPISKNSPLNFQKHGKKYLRYKANQQTTWYIFFDEKNGNFLVNYILNNHDKDFPELI